jgi:hypothetical protein
MGSSAESNNKLQYADYTAKARVALLLLLHIYFRVAERALLSTGRPIRHFD